MALSIVIIIIISKNKILLNYLNFEFVHTPVRLTPQHGLLVLPAKVQTHRVTINIHSYECMWILTRCACTLQVRPPVSTLGCCWLRQQRNAEVWLHAKMIFDDGDDGNGQCHCSVRMVLFQL